MKRKNIALILAGLALCCGCSRPQANGGQPAAPEAASPPYTVETSAEAQSESAGQRSVALISDMPTTQYFTGDPVDEADIEAILYAGINAPSAMNGQPWHFSAITDPAVLEQIAGGMGGGPGGRPGGAGMTPPEGAPEMMDGEMPEMQEGEAPQMPEGEMPETSGDGGRPQGQPQGGAGQPGQGGQGVAKAGLTDAPLAIVISCKDGSELDAGLACQSMSAAARLLGYGTKIVSSPTMALNGDNQAEYKELLGIPEDMAAAAVLLVGREDTTVDETVDGYTAATQRNPFDQVVTYVKPE